MKMPVLLIPLTLLLSLLIKGRKIFIIPTIAFLGVVLSAFLGRRDYLDYTFLLSLFAGLFSVPILTIQIREMFLALSSQAGRQLVALDDACRNIEARRADIHNNIRNLERQNAAVSDLYEMTKDMSGLLQFSEMFGVFQKILSENFSFKGGFLVTLRYNISALEIDKIYRIPSQELEETYLPDASYYKILEYLQHIRESAYVGRNSALRKQFSLVSEENLAFSLLKVENRIIGALILEGLPQEHFDKFSVFSTQFSLELKKVRLYEQIEEMATTDSLTGLYVRRKILELTRDELERAKRCSLYLAFSMLDIDYFKKCNDRYGHLVGDYVLREIARILKTNLREIDLIGRYGGEEFSVILPQTDLEGAKIVAQRISEAVRKYPFKAYGEVFRTTISCGVAIFPDDAQADIQLIDAADRALYAAKNRGRDCVVFYREIAS